MSAMMYKSDVPDTGFSLPLSLTLLWSSDDGSCGQFSFLAKKLK